MSFSNPVITNRGMSRRDIWPVARLPQLIRSVGTFECSICISEIYYVKIVDSFCGPFTGSNVPTERIALWPKPATDQSRYGTIAVRLTFGTSCKDVWSVATRNDFDFRSVGTIDRVYAHLPMLRSNVPMERKTKTFSMLLYNYARPRRFLTLKVFFPNKLFWLACISFGKVQAPSV